MKLLISSFYTVTPEVQHLVESWISNEEEYMLVMIDSANPFYTDSRREDFLSRVFLKRELPLKYLVWNDTTEEELIKSIESTIEELGATDISININFDLSEKGKETLTDLGVKSIDGVRGGLLEEFDRYVSSSSDDWKNRCLRHFESIVKAIPLSTREDTYRVVPYFTIEGGSTIYAVGTDLSDSRLVLLDSYTDDIELVPVMVDVVAGLLKSKAIDWDIRSFSHDFHSHSVVFVEIEDNDYILDVATGNDLVLADNDIVYTFIKNEVSKSYSLEQSWVEGALNEIIHSRKIEKDMS